MTLLPKLPFSLRYSFLEKGYAVVPRSMAFGSLLKPPALDSSSPSQPEESPAFVQSIRHAVLAAARARSDQFLSVPSIESVVKGVVRVQDPMYEKLIRRQQEYAANRRKFMALKKRRDALKRQAKRKASGSEADGGASISSDEIWRLTRAVYEELQSNRDAKLCRSTIDTDPQLRRAIDTHRVNTWMTQRALEDYLRGDVGKIFGHLAVEVGGVSKPVLFSDQPITRPAFGRPHYFHCAAPALGVKDVLGAPSVTVVMPLHTPSEIATQFFVMSKSHRAVRGRLGQLSHSARGDLLTATSTKFLPLESHMRHMVEHLLPSKGDDEAQSALLADVKSEAVVGLCAGDVLVMDSCLLWGLGPNFTGVESAVWKAHIVGEEAEPSVDAPSWISDWRSNSARVDFRATAVFPPLY